jgi:hypothetical protein
MSEGTLQVWISLPTITECPLTFPNVRQHNYNRELNSVGCVDADVRNLNWEQIVILKLAGSEATRKDLGDDSVEFGHNDRDFDHVLLLLSENTSSPEEALMFRRKLTMQTRQLIEDEFNWQCIQAVAVEVTSTNCCKIKKPAGRW